MPQGDDTTARQRWLGLLARAANAELEQALAGLAAEPEHTTIRAPETGMVMVRARAGGSGQRFNLGEMTVTRAAVRLADGTIGQGYVSGRDHDHARRVALLDAVLQGDEATRDALEDSLLTPLATRLAEQRERTRRRAAATRVDFFTMAREGGA